MAETLQEGDSFGIGIPGDAVEGDDNAVTLVNLVEKREIVVLKDALAAAAAETSASLAHEAAGAEVYVQVKDTYDDTFILAVPGGLVQSLARQQLGSAAGGAGNHSDDSGFFLLNFLAGDEEG